MVSTQINGETESHDFVEPSASLQETPHPHSPSQLPQLTPVLATTAAPILNKPAAEHSGKHISGSENEAQADKRRRNNAAAAKYRQKKIDRISDLEKALETVSDERDALKLQLAKKDTEVELLRQLLAEKE